MHFIACSKVWSKLHFWFHSVVQYQSALSILSNCSPDTPKYSPTSLPSKSWNMFAGTLPGMPSRMRLIPLDGPHPPGLTICSNVYSQDTAKYIPSTLPSTPLSMLSSTLPRMLSRTLPLEINGISPGYLRVQFCICSRDTFKHTSQHAL